MSIIEEIAKNTSLWEIVAFIVILYLLFSPKLLNRITKFKIGDFELELKALKEDITKSNDRIIEIESDLESERRFFVDILESFDSNSPVSDLSSIRQSIKSHARNISEVDSLKQYLKMDVSPKELFVAAVSIREKRPITLLPDILNFLEVIADNKRLGGYRPNTIWTLTSGVHLILISAIRDGVAPFPSEELLDYAYLVLKKLNENPKVIKDRPNNPMKGIKGPIKYSIDWIRKGKEKYKI